LKKILLIEDEKNLARFVELELRHEDYSVTVAYDGKTGLDLALQDEWSVILLDIMLPELNGIEVCRRIRSLKKTPIIMLTARDNVVDRVTGLDSGADDYLPKPFAIEELLARIRAVSRRFEENQENEHNFLSLQNLIVDLDARKVTNGDHEIVCSKREFDLLVMFIQNANRVLTREQLLDKVWGYDSEVEMKIVDVYVRYLRNKIDIPGEESLIHTMRGIGYMMKK
jgi:DNA-binding response OmpR family regulator